MAAGLVKGDVRSFTYAQTSSDRADWSASCNIGSRRTFDRRHRVMSASTRPDATYGQRRMAINRAHRVRGGARLDLPGPADEAHGPNPAPSVASSPRNGPELPCRAFHGCRARVQLGPQAHCQRRRREEAFRTSMPICPPARRPMMLRPHAPNCSQDQSGSARAVAEHQLGQWVWIVLGTRRAGHGHR